MHQEIKALAKPENNARVLTDALVKFHSVDTQLPANVTTEQAHAWLDERITERHNLINQGDRAYLDDAAFSALLLSKIQPALSRELYQMLEGEARRYDQDLHGRCTNRHTLKGIKHAFEMQWPVHSCAAKPKATVHYAGGAGQPDDVTEPPRAIHYTEGGKCTTCGYSNHTAEQCHRNPAATCDMCHGRGHTKEVCPSRPRGAKGRGKGGKGSKGGRGRDTGANQKALREQAEFGKAMMALHAQSATPAPAGASPAAPPIFPVAQQASSTATPGIFNVGGTNYYRRADETLAPVPALQSPQVQAPAGSNYFTSAMAGRINALTLPPDSVDTRYVHKGPSSHLKEISEPEVFHRPEVSLDEQSPLGSSALSGLMPGGSTIMLCGADAAATPSPDWWAVDALIDGGADESATANGSAIHFDGNNYSIAPTATGNGYVCAQKLGDMYIMIGNDQVHRLDRSAHHPNLSLDLILSRDQLKEQGITTDQDNCRLVLRDGTIVPGVKHGINGRLMRVMVYVYVGNSADMPALNFKSSKPQVTIQDVHDMLGCPGEEALRNTLPLVDGLPDVSHEELQECLTCPRAKDKRQPIERNPDVPPRQYKLCEAVGADISARCPISIQGANYFQLIVEMHSRYIVGQLLALKSDCAEAIREFCATHFMPDIIQIDGDGAYELLMDFCIAMSIELRRSAPDTQAQNFIAEIGMKLVVIGARADLLRSGLPIKFWADAVMNFIDSLNCRWTKGVKSGLTPYEEYHGRRPDLSMKRKFGQPANVLIHHPEGKFTDRVVRGVYVRVAMGYKAWKIYLPDHDCYVVSRHVTFNMLPPAMSPADPEVEVWMLGPIKEDKGKELYDAHKPAPPSKSVTPSDSHIVANPLPTHKKSADLSTRSMNTGKDGRFNDWQAFCNQRTREYEAAGKFQGMSKEKARQARLKAVGVDWKLVKAALDNKNPLPQLDPPHVSSATVHHAAALQPAHDEGGVLMYAQSEPESQPSPESTHASTVIQAIRTIEDTNGPIQRGHFTDQSWATMCALMGDPTSVLEALNGPDSEYWRQAIQTELQSLIDLDVYEEIERADVPKDKKILLSKIVLKYKVFEKRFKARLVVLGFMQPDEDAGETFAPVAKFTTFRILMAIACALDLEISASDVATAFLNAVLTDPIYIYPPRSLGFPPNVVWKLLKNLYGLKGAPRGWNATLHAFLLELGFIQSVMDPCLYFIAGLWVLVWVDDCLKVGTREATTWFEGKCDERFSMTHVETVEMFVGIEISRDRPSRTLELHQKGYNDKVLKKFSMVDDEGKPDYGPDTPMAEGTKVSKGDCCNGDPDKKAEFDKLEFPYISAAASLLYSSIALRPDLSFTAKECCKVMSDPGPKHVPILKRALKYLRATRN